MARIAIIGDGPAGLSAALLLAKNGQDVTVYGRDATLLHHAQLHNYLGVPDTSGSEFTRIARQQVGDVGAQLLDDEVTAIDQADDGFTLELVDGGTASAEHVVVAGGTGSRGLLERLGAEVRDGAVVVDGEARTSVDRVYAAGHMVRPDRSQAITSAGLGAAAALDILSREAGQDVHDWDTP